MSRPLSLLLLLFASALAGAAWAEPLPGSGADLRRIDGDNLLGEHFAVIPGAFAGTYVGFLYFADEGRLYAADCGAGGCNVGAAITPAGRDRGRHVSAALRPGAPSLPFVASYDVTDGDLVAIDCGLNASNCGYGGVQRILDSAGDVGQYTATTIDVATGFPLISYYDASNGDLKLYACANAACSSGSATLVDAAGDRGRHSAIAYSSGTLWIAYDDVGSGEVMLARATSPFASFSIVSLGAGSAPALSALADGSGGVDVVWRGNSDSLMHQHCPNATCAGGTQQGLAGTNLGFGASARRLPNGRLFVSHQDGATGSARGLVCANTTCSTDTHYFTFENGPGLGERSNALHYADGRPFAVYRDAVRNELRQAECTTTACTAFTRRITSNGFAVGAPGVAVRADGRPLVTWVRRSDRLPRLALCADVRCSSFEVRVLGGANSDSATPAVIERPDGRPFVYYAAVGGSSAWDCADSACTSGTPREVSGSGNSTSDIIKLDQRSDGRPLMLYYQSSTQQVWLFLCDDVNCSSGTPRLLADESSSLTAFALAVGNDDRAIASYSLFAGPQKFVRCVDVDCLSLETNVVAATASYSSALALRADQRPLIASQRSVSREVVICDNAACSGNAPFPVPNIGVVRSLALASGERPVLDYGTTGSAGLTACDDPTCTGVEVRTLLSDAGSNASFEPALALRSDGGAVLAALAERESDLWLAIEPPALLFVDGFE